MKKTFLYPILFLIIFSGCKSKQQAASGRHAQIQGTVRQAVERIRQAEPQFRTANFGKLSLSLNLNDRNINLSATCKIVKDSAMHLSVMMPFLGTEMVKAELTPKNIRVFDKINSRLYETDYGFIAQQTGIPVDFFAIQALFSNTFFTLGCPAPCIDNCRVENSQIIFEKAGIRQQTTIDSLFHIVSLILTKENRDYSLSVDYGEFTSYGKSGIPFPQRIAIGAGSENSQTKCLLGISRVEFDGNISLTPLNTELYQPQNVESLLKILK